MYGPILLEEITELTGGRSFTIERAELLPAIAEKRVLRCKDENARKELDAAFEQVARMKDSVMSILLTHEGSRGMFRQVYPFSPALASSGRSFRQCTYIP